MMDAPRLLPADFEAELLGNILPFWMERTPDAVNGGFYGALTNDLQVRNDAPRSAVLYARILWTFAAASRLYSQPAYLQTARRAYDYIRQHFVDAQHGGVFWAVDAHGQPLDARKHTYAQAFTIYGLAEFYRATGETPALQLAQELYRLVERHTFDAALGGNLECRARDWQPLDDMRLSPKDMNCAKSMNTLLHLMEAYTNLLRVWQPAELRDRLIGLLRVFREHIVDAPNARLGLYFDAAWQSLSSEISYGHDIEASWLLVEAAEEAADAPLLAWARANTVRMADAVYTSGRNADGSLPYELVHGVLNAERHWWVQAEAVVGFYNAWQISSEERFASAAAAAWQYIRQHFVDPQHGDWFKILDAQGTPRPDAFKAGPWECPYHHSRLCFEMLRRLPDPAFA